MARKIDATGICAVAFRGDMPLDLFLERETFLAFLLWLRRLPKHHGKCHGRNVYAKEGVVLDKHEEIAATDEKDFEVTEAIRVRHDLDQRWKRAELAERLEVSMTDEAVEKHHARVSAIVGAAKSELAWTGPDFVSVLKEFRRKARPPTTVLRTSLRCG